MTYRSSEGSSFHYVLLPVTCCSSLHLALENRSLLIREYIYIFLSFHSTITKARSVQLKYLKGKCCS